MTICPCSWTLVEVQEPLFRLYRKDASFPDPPFKIPGPPDEVWPVDRYNILYLKIGIRGSDNMEITSPHLAAYKAAG